MQKSRAISRDSLKRGCCSGAKKEDGGRSGGSGGSPLFVLSSPEDRVEYPQICAHQRKGRYVEGEEAVYLFFDVHDGVTQGEERRAERDEEVVHRAERHRGGFGFGRWLRLPGGRLRLALLLLR